MSLQVPLVEVPAPEPSAESGELVAIMRQESETDREVRGREGSSKALDRAKGAALMLCQLHMTRPVVCSDRDLLCLCFQRLPAPALAPACVQMMEVGTRAFVSYVRGYKEHQLKYIFRIQVTAKEVGLHCTSLPQEPNIGPVLRCGAPHILSLLLSPSHVCPHPPPFHSGPLAPCSPSLPLPPALPSAPRT